MSDRLVHAGHLMLEDEAFSSSQLTPSDPSDSGSITCCPNCCCRRLRRSSAADLQARFWRAILRPKRTSEIPVLFRTPGESALFRASEQSTLFPSSCERSKLL